LACACLDPVGIEFVAVEPFVILSPSTSSAGEKGQNNDGQRRHTPYDKQSHFHRLKFDLTDFFVIAVDGGSQLTSIL